MSENKKKSLEREYLNSFLELYDNSPGGKIISTESPDFILFINRKKSIGIELTRLIVNYPTNNKHLSREDLNAVIQKKNEKLKLYRKKRIDFYWLIIIIEDETSDTIIHQHTAEWNFVTSFHRIFLFYPIKKQIMDISG